MPIYEYECPKCGTFEASQRITEAPLTACETCASPVRRVLSSSTFALKGGGWYKDLYSSASKAVGTGAPTSSSSSASTSKPDSAA